MRCLSGLFFLAAPSRLRQPSRARREPLCCMPSEGNRMMRFKPPHTWSRKPLHWTWMIVAALAVDLAGLGFVPSTVHAGQSDLNHDGVIDLEDLKIFSDKTLKQDWETVDWCAWISVDGRYQDKHDELVDFIREYLECDQPPPPPPEEDPLAVKHDNIYPTRLAWGPDGKLYVSDPQVRSVFIYTVTTDELGETTLNRTGELKKVGQVVGLAVDDAGLVIVGNSQRRRIEKYNLQGDLVAVMGEGTLRMPTDLAFDADNNLYVADSEVGVVWVYKPDGTLLRTIRRGGLKSPMAVEIAYFDDGSGTRVGELYVGDKMNRDSNGSLQPRVKVFDLEGNLLRSYGGFIERSGMMGWAWKGRFVGLQSLAVDGNGRLHALDCYINKVQILDSLTGGYLDYYGEPGSATGELKTPLDIIISDAGVVVLANAGNRRVEVLYTIP